MHGVHTQGVIQNCIYGGGGKYDPNYLSGMYVENFDKNAFHIAGNGTPKVFEVAFKHSKF